MVGSFKGVFGGSTDPSTESDASNDQANTQSSTARRANRDPLASNVGQTSSACAPAPKITRASVSMNSANQESSLKLIQQDSGDFFSIATQADLKTKLALTNSRTESKVSSGDAPVKENQSRSIPQLGNETALKLPETDETDLFLRLTSAGNDTSEDESDSGIALTPHRTPLPLRRSHTQVPNEVEEESDGSVESSTAEEENIWEEISTSSGLSDLDPEGDSESNAAESSDNEINVESNDSAANEEVLSEGEGLILTIGDGTPDPEEGGNGARDLDSGAEAGEANTPVLGARSAPTLQNDAPPAHPATRNINTAEVRQQAVNNDTQLNSTEKLGIFRKFIQKIIFLLKLTAVFKNSREAANSDELVDRLEEVEKHFTTINNDISATTNVLNRQKEKLTRQIKHGDFKAGHDTLSVMTKFSKTQGPRLQNEANIAKWAMEKITENHSSSLKDLQTRKAELTTRLENLSSKQYSGTRIRIQRLKEQKSLTKEINHIQGDIENIQRNIEYINETNTNMANLNELQNSLEEANEAAELVLFLGELADALVNVNETLETASSATLNNPTTLFQTVNNIKSSFTELDNILTKESYQRNEEKSPLFNQIIDLVTNKVNKKKTEELATRRDSVLEQIKIRYLSRVETELAGELRTLSSAEDSIKEKGINKDDLTSVKQLVSSIRSTVYDSPIFAKVLGESSQALSSKNKNDALTNFMRMGQAFKTDVEDKQSKLSEIKEIQGSIRDEVQNRVTSNYCSLTTPTDRPVNDSAKDFVQGILDEATEQVVAKINASKEESTSVFPDYDNLISETLDLLTPA